MPFLKRWWPGLLAVLVLAGFWRLRLDVDVLHLLPPDLPAVQGLELYQEYFANARELIITVRARDGEQAEHLAAALAERLRLESNLVAGVAWQPPWVEHPAQVGELAAYLWFNQPPAVLAGLTNHLAQDHLGAVLGEARETLATSMSPLDIARRAFDPYDLLNVAALADFGGMSAEQGQRMFSSAEGTFRQVFVQARPDLSGYRACTAWLTSVRGVADEVRRSNPDWTGAIVRYTGRPAFVVEIAGSMQHDLRGSILGTALIIALLFWLTHRRWLPMLWLLSLLVVILGATMGLGGLIFGAVNIVSLGFAAVLLGLAVDYAVVHYQEALAQPELSVPEIRRAIAPSILWAAITTISAFLVLNLGGLPGLAQLGSLVAVGVALAALVMVVAFLPPLFPARRHAPATLPAWRWRSFLVPPAERPMPRQEGSSGAVSRGPLLLTGLLVLLVGAVLCFKRPGLDRTADPLRPQHTEAEVALEEITASVGIPQDPLWVIVSGTNEAGVDERLTRAEAVLQRARSNQFIKGYLLPVALWPRPDYQEANRATASLLGGRGPSLVDAALKAGFNTNALLITDELVHTWARAGSSRGVFWPTNQMSRWLLNRFVARTADGWLALGLVYAPTNTVASASLGTVSDELERCGARLSGWGLLGEVLLKRVQHRLWELVLPMVALVLTSLWLAFRRVREVLLGVGVLCLSGLCLLAVMALAGWSWNLLNLMALPLILGTGVDYALFIQLALRRHGGDTARVRGSIGRALLLCGGTAITGFGSLAWSGNLGMAGLGRVCVVGIGANMLISIYLLPTWWTWLCRGHGIPGAGGPLGASSPLRRPAPSAFYGAPLWRLGLVLARRVPPAILQPLCLLLAEIHYRTNRRRREMVIQNLLPPLLDDRARAERTARALYHQFALKLLALWRFESGVPTEVCFPDRAGLERVEGIRKRGQGVLLLTPHLGNWEIGGPMLVRHGFKLVVITQAEPGDGLTELRIASRARWGVETLVIGNDAFAFVEVIKRLQEGSTVALLMDRPPASGAVMVEFFGRPFRASAAAAELARATGCALVGVVVIQTPDGGAVEVVTEFTYDRRALGNREARRELTQHILRAFEPVIRQHLDQWFHFVPIWPPVASDGASPRRQE